MTPQQLEALNRLQLIDVRLADDFEAAHIDGAMNNGVFEVAFLDRLAETAPDHNMVTVVYGADRDSHEAEMAAQKLRHQGFTDVNVLEVASSQPKRLGSRLTRERPLLTHPHKSTEPTRSTSENLAASGWGRISSTNTGA